MPPSEVDLTRLTYRGPDGVTLVRSRGRPFITIKEFNDWLGSYPLNLTSQEPAVARRQALEQMVAFKLIVAKARETGYEQKVRSPEGVLDDRSLAMSYVRDQLANQTAVTDRQADAYYAANPARFGRVVPDDAPPELKRMAVKVSMQGERLWERVKSWMEQASLTYSEDAG